MKLESLTTSNLNILNLTLLTLHNNQLKELPKNIINLSNFTISNNPKLILTSEQKMWIKRFI